MTVGSAIGYWLAAWTLIIVILIALSHTRSGRVIIYYGAWGSVVFILVTHSDAIATIFQQGNITAGEV